MINNNYIKIGIASPIVHLGNPLKNANEIIEMANELKDASIICFPELSITGYSIGDLFLNYDIIEEEEKALELIINSSNNNVWIIGSFLQYEDKLYDVAYVIQNKKILGAVPKIHMQSNLENIENRVFSTGISFRDRIVEVTKCGQTFNFGLIMFDNDKCSFGIELSDDLYNIDAPHIKYYQSGAHIIFNLSASSFQVGKSYRRTSLCENTSFLGNGAYVYVSTSSSETSSDVIMSGHCLVSELGETLINHKNMPKSYYKKLVDIDLMKINYKRQQINHEETLKTGIFTVPYCLRRIEDFNLPIDRNIVENPFILNNEMDKSDVISALSTALYNRLNHVGSDKVVIGVSGGLDSTLALLIINECFNMFKLDKAGIYAYTMPGLGTGNKSKNNAYDLCNSLGITLQEIDIREEVIHHFNLIGKDESKKDITFENIQARYRTLVLMNIANKNNAIVCGTGDMSEIALGWATFNGDHISMYNINGGLPKTSIRDLCKYFINLYPEAEDAIQAVVDLPISPELTGADQKTEDIIGKYEINDFIMYHVFNSGAGKNRIIYLLKNVYKLSDEESSKYYDNFMKRFYRNQFKRLTGAESIKIFDISLAPRSNLRIPGDIKR